MESIHDPRFYTLLLISGLGTLGVGIAAHPSVWAGIVFFFSIGGMTGVALCGLIVFALEGKK